MNIIRFHHMLYRPNLLYLAYKKLRAPFGIPLGFVLMYGAYNGNFTSALLLAGVGFFFIELFGTCYNDYWDYDEDIRNNRRDKFTTIGVLTKEQIRDISFIIALLALISLVFTNIRVFLLGLYYLTLLVFYSHPKVRLKGDITGYFALASVFLLLPRALNSLISIELSAFGIAFALFFFLQFMYILCQKDSTDPNDDTNLFIDRGWDKSSVITLIFAALSSLFLLIISISSIGLLLVWVINAFSKIVNVNKIWKKTITREFRSRIIIIELLTPYLYVGAMTLGL